jgi:hypothetical protein
MQRTLSVERVARFKAEQRYNKEVMLRARVERELAAAQSKLVSLEEAHNEWIAATAETLADNLTRFSEVLAGQQNLSSASLSGPHFARPRDGESDVKGKGRMTEGMTADQVK